MRIPEDFRCYLSMHKDCSDRLLARVEDLTGQELEISPDPHAMRQRKMVHAVLGELHRMKAFVRLKPLGAQVLYGYLKPTHKIGEQVCDHFARRNPGIIIALGNGSESWISLCLNGRVLRDRGNGITAVLERLRSALDCTEEGENLEGLWQVYYDSQYCPERRNPGAFNRHMPRRDQEAAGLRIVQNKKEIKLEDFI